MDQPTSPEIEGNGKEIERIILILELRDTPTAEHCIRVANYAAVLGTSLGMVATDCEALLRAAKLHDLGKLGVPDSILLKRETLGPAEQEMMRCHTQRGAEMLSGAAADVLKMAARIARGHHERWDGSGYPDGLEGEAIPLEARIVGLCDAFDVMSTDQNYRKAMSFDQAVREIKAGAGTQFDPGLVERFLSVLPSIEQLWRSLRRAAQ